MTAHAAGAAPAGAPRLAWTGHALVDVGIAGMLAFAGRTRPEELTLEDLDAAADFMVEHYYSGKLLSYLTCVFMNSSFVQPREGEEKRQAFISQYLRAHRAEPHAAVVGRSCVFSGAPATSPLTRTQLPLFSGEGVLNYRPDGETDVPAAGPIVVALMFLPMASRKAEGKLLAVHADEPDLTLRFARKYLEDNRRLLQLAQPTARAAVYPGLDREMASWDPKKRRYKYADVKGPRSLVVADLGAIAGDVAPSELRPRAAVVTAYLLSSSGQGPSLEIFQLPSGVTSFVLKAGGARTSAAWKAVAERFSPIKESADDEEATADAGRRRRRGSRAAASGIAGRPGWSRNPAFEKLCDIFDPGFIDRGAAAAWLRRFVLGRIEKANQIGYETTRARSWALAELFLQEVMGMTKGEIEAIRIFADKLAGWIHERNDGKLHRALAFDKPWVLRARLLRVQRESARHELLFGLEEFGNVWLHPDRDEYLVRDLVCLSVVEKLYTLGWYAEHPEDVLEGVQEPGAADASVEETVS
jgi:CRISPR-associated protein Cst1